MGAQHTANKAAALVCSHCFQFLGPLQDQISHCLPQLPGLEASGMTAAPRWAHKPLHMLQAYCVSQCRQWNAWPCGRSAEAEVGMLRK